MKVVSSLTLLLIFNGGVWLLIFLSAQFYPLFLGLAVLSYGFGFRHAVDADHIAAIDNVTRKLIHEGQKPVAVGFFFSLGHSTVVIILSALVAISASFINQNLPKFSTIGSLIGTSFSSLFLLTIGVINLIAVIEIISTRHQTQVLSFGNKGILTRILKPLLKTVRVSWQMYFIGFLFGLGFDTATEIALLSISAASAMQGIPVLTILLLPLAFTASMTLIDTLDGILMLKVYGWAYIEPARKFYYNLIITLISAVTALLIGGIQALQIFNSLTP